MPLASGVQQRSHCMQALMWGEVMYRHMTQDDC